MEWIWNVPYSPDFQPIESVFSQVKRLSNKINPSKNTWKVVTLAFLFNAVNVKKNLVKREICGHIFKEDM